MSDSLQALHTAHQATLSEVAGKSLPLGYGDFAGEVAAIEQGLGVLVLEASGVLLLRGPDAAEFLAGMTTNDVKALAAGQAHFNLLCATKGKILHEIVVVRAKEEDLLVLAAPGEARAVAGHLEQYHIREDLELGLMDWVRLELLGPGIGAGLEAAGLPVDDTRGAFGEGPVLLPRLPLGALPRVLALLPPATAPALVETLLERAGARLVGMDAFDEARVWAGMPRFGLDYGSDHLPAEAALYDHISFNKGCYVGQEVHARMHYRGHPNRKLSGVTLPGTAEGVQAGSELYLGDTPLGALTSVTRLARDGSRRGIAMLRHRDVQDHPRLSLLPGGPPEVELWALACDLGAAKA